MLILLISICGTSITCSLKTDAADSKVQTIIDFAYSKLHSAAYSGYCQAFVKDCYEAAGIYASSNAGSADEARNRWCISTDLSNIPVGACVYWKDNHVAIYLGNDRIIHTVSGVYDSSKTSYVCETSLSYYTNRNKIHGWGYQAGYDLYANGGSTTPAYTITNSAYADLTDTSVTIKAKLNKITTNMSECGVFIGTSTSNMTQIRETVTVGNEVMYMSYGTGKWYGTLTPGTTYYYQFYAIIGGTTYWGELASFTTTRVSPIPQGYLDSASGNLNKICFSGWAADWEQPSTALEIHVYLNGPAGTGTYLGSMIADQYRPDVNGTYPYHGFSGEFFIKDEGFYTAYLYAINVGAGGENPLIGVAENVLVYADVTPPEISNVKVTDITETGYTITCTVTDNVRVNRVQFPSWTLANDQDDLPSEWWTNQACRGTINGNQVTFRVNISDHNYEYGEYMTHIYAIDDVENRTSYSIPVVYVTNENVCRVFGSDRYQTSYKTADALKDELGIEKYDTVIVTSGKNFPDALVGSYLAKVKNAPILMVNERNVDNLTQYLKKNLKKGGRLYVLGGGAAVPSEWWKDWGDFSICRLEGENRYDTNLMILDEAGVSTQPILICTGKDFPDSLSASATGMPILLVNNKELSVSQKMFLSAHKGNKFYIIGGEGAISKNMEAQIQKYGNTERIAGGNRYETSVRIAEKFFPNAKDSVIAYAKNYPDGLCGGPLAMSKNAPVILTAPGKEAMAKSYMNARNIKKGVVLGGDTLITDNAVKEIYGVSSITVW